MTSLGLRKNEIGFAAFAAWDAAGAAWFGYPTAWVNRQAQPPQPGAVAVQEAVISASSIGFWAPKALGLDAASAFQRIDHLHRPCGWIWFDALAGHSAERPRASIDGGKAGRPAAQAVGAGRQDGDAA